MIQITNDDLDYIGIHKKAWNDINVKSVDPFSSVNKGRFSLSAHFVDITCGPYKQDIMCNLAGKKGSGKSYSSLEIARCCAIRTAIKLDNDESKWTDYFSMDNVAIMDVDKMIDILTSNEKHQVIISDDSGTIQGARKFRSDDNQDLNDVFVVNRTNNCIYLSSAPESSHVDKQARNLPEHQIDFVKNYAGLSSGWATCKYFQKTTDPKSSVSYHSYHYWNDMKVLRCIIQAPPKSLTDEYDKMREAGKARIQAKLQERKEQREREAEEAKEKRLAGGTREKQREERQKLKDAGRKLYDEEILKGSSKKEALQVLKNELGINPGTWTMWEYRGEI